QVVVDKAVAGGGDEAAGVRQPGDGCRGAAGGGQDGGRQQGGGGEPEGRAQGRSPSWGRRSRGGRDDSGCCSPAGALPPTPGAPAANAGRLRDANGPILESCSGPSWVYQRSESMVIMAARGRRTPEIPRATTGSPGTRERGTAAARRPPAAPE